MSRVVTISAISTRGGASRMSMPDGSRHSTSARSASAIRSVGRSRIDGASTGHLQQCPQVAELEAAVDEHGPLADLAEGDREIEGDGRLADPALRGEHADDARATVSVACADLWTFWSRVIRSKPGERHREDAVDAPSGIRDDGLLRDGQHDDRDAEAGVVDLLDDLSAP